MKIISWNCNGKFREKFKYISKLNADIYVIQECENPNCCTDINYFNFATNHIWIGQSKSKGLGIFARQSIDLQKLSWSYNCFRYFLPIKINKSYTLLGVWTTKPSYIEEYYIYQYINIKHYDDKTIIIGDFNSNSIWDNKNHDRDHTSVVNSLNEKGFVSAYHYLNNEKQGFESSPTFLFHKKLDSPYHIDYCFLNKNMIKNFYIDNKNQDYWLKYSDHIPLILEIN